MASIKASSLAVFTGLNKVIFIYLIYEPCSICSNFTAFSSKVQCHWFAIIQRIPVNDNSITDSNDFSLSSISALTI